MQMDWKMSLVIWSGFLYGDVAVWSHSTFCHVNSKSMCSDGIQHIKYLETNSEHAVKIKYCN